MRVIPQGDDITGRIPPLLKLVAAAWVSGQIYKVYLISRELFLSIRQLNISKGENNIM